MKTASTLASLILALGPILISLLLGLETQQLITTTWSAVGLVIINSIIRIIEITSEDGNPEATLMRSYNTNIERPSLIKRVLIG